MEFTTLHILWFIPAITQGMVRLDVSPRITAECDKQVTLECNASSPSGLSIKHMQWLRSKTPLCYVNSKGEISHKDNTSLSDFNCQYEDGQLSITFTNLQPLETGDSQHYMCKVRSDKGEKHHSTTVELQECGQIAEHISRRVAPACTFKVHPDGEVHWFHGSHNLSDGSIEHYTTKQVDERGWLIIHSELKEWSSSDVPYNCSLKGSKSGKYIASNTVLISNEAGSSYSQSSGAGSQASMRTLLCISILLAVTLK